MKNLAGLPRRTIPQLLDDTVKKNGAAPALRTKRDGAWHSINWSDYRDQIRQTARGFMKLGLEPGQGVSIIGYNCVEWFVADLGAIHAGGFPAGIYTTNTAGQCKYIAEHSDSAIAVVENAEQLAKLEEIRAELPKLKAIVVMFGDAGNADAGVYSWAELQALGDEVPETELDARIAALKPDDIATLIYTSGTTGDPKAVMISHDNAVWTATVVMETFTDIWERQHGNRNIDVQAISYLPLSHIAEQVISIYCPTVAGGCVSFAESLEALGENLREVRPTIFLGVPRVWEKIQAKIVAAGKQNTGLKKKIGAWARQQGLAGGFAEQQGKAKPLLYGLADKLVFSKVKALLGLDRALGQFTSAAPISRDTLELFLSLGIPIYEIYGMSECTGPATMSTPDKYRTGKAGFCLPGAELKIADDGEICMRGRHVCLGYYKNEAATREAIDADGWLHSGDLGSIDRDGHLEITGRKKDLIITSGGENIAPQVIEGMLVAIPIVGQAVVIGDGRKFLSALFTLDPSMLTSTAKEIGSPATDLKTAAGCPKFRDHVDAQLTEINTRLARVQTIKKFQLLPEEFTIDGGELTPTMKIKRRVVNEKYQGEIESLYAEQ